LFFHDFFVLKKKINAHIEIFLFWFIGPPGAPGPSGAPGKKKKDSRNSK
jgi:hypothetical protein